MEFKEVPSDEVAAKFGELHELRRFFQHDMKKVLDKPGNQTVYFFRDVLCEKKQREFIDLKDKMPYFIQI
jgi:hypothetical protein